MVLLHFSSSFLLDSYINAFEKNEKKKCVALQCIRKTPCSDRGCDSATLQRFTDSFFFTAGAKLIKHFNRVGTESESLLEKVIC